MEVSTWGAAKHKANKGDDIRLYLMIFYFLWKMIWHTICVCIYVYRKTHTHSWPSIFMDSTSMDSTNFGLKFFGKKYYIVADSYYVLRPPMVASVPKMYRIEFFCPYSLNNTLQQLFTSHLHCVRDYK